MAAPVLFLSSRKARDERLAGGKGAGLARLARAGLQVPPGFVITTPAFREAITLAFEHIKASASSPALSVRPDLLQAARQTLLAWDMPTPLPVRVPPVPEFTL
ncbi:MAG: hypothetical protein FJY79_06685 [Candidatus Aminicenantes bacterium]|nr:hypothetical protein [Candidatus Aminicenantes bacterium]